MKNTPKTKTPAKPARAPEKGSAKARLAKASTDALRAARDLAAERGLPKPDNFVPLRVPGEKLPPSLEPLAAMSHLNGVPVRVSRVQA